MNDRSLKENASDFLCHKRSLGYVYSGQGCLIERYVIFAEGLGDPSPVPTKETVAAFIGTLSDSPGTLYQAVAALREFSRYLQLYGFADAYVVPSKTVSQPVADPPYFFTKLEIDAFFEQVDSIEPNRSFKGRDIILPTLFRLLYCCGMRCREARMLACNDVHAEDRYIDIIQSKGPKSRRIFISRELADWLIDYDKRIRIIFPGREYFFPNGRAGHFSSRFISANFKRLWLKAFPGFEMTTRPRAYDLRHHFAWSNLNRWAAEGLDLNVMLPYLMRYMGHQTVNGTLYYFRFVPEFFPTYSGMAHSLEDVLPEVPHEE